jgi:hypothetical protein
MTSLVLAKMIAYFKDDVERINHAVKVYGFAQTIARMEAVDPERLTIIELAAILHDIGIQEAERKHHSAAGEYQEMEGPPIAEAILRETGVDERLTERVVFLVGHHHSYERIDEIDFRILVEADFVVNIFEWKMNRETIDEFRDRYVRTTAGLSIINSIYGTI